MSGIVGYLVASGVLAVMATLGGAILYWWNSIYESGKTAQKLKQSKANEDALKKAGEIIAEQRTSEDASNRLGGGTF
jgi:hypothetical protein